MLLKATKMFMSFCMLFIEKSSELLAKVAKYHILSVIIYPKSWIVFQWLIAKDLYSYLKFTFFLLNTENQLSTTLAILLLLESPSVK